MDFKFAVGNIVEYKPIGGKVGLFTVLKQMPEEFQAFDRRYRIKSEHENVERNVLECDLSAPDKPAEAYDSRVQMSRMGSRR